MSPLTSSALQRCNTARTLVKAVRAKEGQGQDSAAALFAKDQVRVRFFYYYLKKSTGVLNLCGIGEKNMQRKS